MLASFAMVSGYMVQPLGSASCHASAAGAARLPSPCLQADDGPLAGAQAAFSIYQKSQAQHREVEEHVWWMLCIESRCCRRLCMVLARVWCTHGARTAHARRRRRAWTSSSLSRTPSPAGRRRRWRCAQTTPPSLAFTPSLGARLPLPRRHRPCPPRLKLHQLHRLRLLLHVK